MENKYRKYKQKYISSQMNKFGGSDEKKLSVALEKISAECKENLKQIAMHNKIIENLTMTLTNLQSLDEDFVSGINKIKEESVAKKKQIIVTFTENYKQFYEDQLKEYTKLRKESTEESLALKTMRECLQILNATFKEMFITVTNITDIPV